MSPILRVKGNVCNSSQGNSWNTHTHIYRVGHKHIKGQPAKQEQATLASPLAHQPPSADIHHFVFRVRLRFVVNSGSPHVWLYKVPTKACALCYGTASVVILLEAAIISTLWQRGRFIKMALPAFMTSIIKANPIMFLPEMFNILQPAIEIWIRTLSIAGTVPEHYRPKYILHLIYLYFPLLNTADT